MFRPVLNALIYFALAVGAWVTAALIFYTAIAAVNGYSAW